MIQHGQQGYCVVGSVPWTPRFKSGASPRRADSCSCSAYARIEREMRDGTSWRPVVKETTLVYIMEARRKRGNTRV